jgi:hypothetical protein
VKDNWTALPSDKRKALVGKRRFLPSTFWLQHPVAKGVVSMSNAIQLPEQTVVPQQGGTPPVRHLIHIVVEVSKHDHRTLAFDHDVVTGREIKAAANVPLDNDLAIREPGRIDELVTNDEQITIKDGEHFVVLPPGTIS